MLDWYFSGSANAAAPPSAQQTKRTAALSSSNPDIDSVQEAKSDSPVNRDDEDQWKDDGWDNEDDWGDMNVSDLGVLLFSIVPMNG